MQTKATGAYCAKKIDKKRKTKVSFDIKNLKDCAHCAYRNNMWINRKMYFSWMLSNISFERPEGAYLAMFPQLYVHVYKGFKGTGFPPILDRDKTNNSQ